MKTLFQLILLCSISYSQTFYQGGDLSFTTALEDCGAHWKENNVVKDIFSIFKDNGANIARFRIWHTPSRKYSTFTDVDTLIARAKLHGMKVMLDFHYSDTWTDPSNQKCPAAWNSVVNNNTALADSLYNYTKAILKKLKDKNRMPEFVQVGNETNGGLCFAGDGKVTWPTDWTRMKLLFNAGIKAVRETDASCKIILHVADPTNAEWWAGELKKNGVTDYDILGISYYPMWHTKKIPETQTILSNIKSTYNKDVMIVETGLPWTDAWNDNTTNVTNGVPEGYGTTSSPENQVKWLIDLSKAVKAAGGIGIVYWEPGWIASGKDSCPSEFGGSTWENQTFFDFNSNLMPNGGIKFMKDPVNVSIQSSRMQTQSSQVFLSKTRFGFILTCNSEIKAGTQFSIVTLQGATLFKCILNKIPAPLQYEIQVPEINRICRAVVVSVGDKCYLMQQVR